MIVFLALDNKNGMMLNNRRQSRDSELLKYLFTVADDQKVLVHTFSQKMLKDYAEHMVVRDDFLTAAGEGDICFVENQHMMEHVDKIEAIYVFRWNRDYLSDFKLDVDLAQWDRSVVCEFTGSSHDCITVEKYIKI